MTPLPTSCTGLPLACAPASGASSVTPVPAAPARADRRDQPVLDVVEPDVHGDLLADDHVRHRGDLDVRVAGRGSRSERGRGSLARADRRDARRVDGPEVDADVVADREAARCWRRRSSCRRPPSEPRASCSSWRFRPPRRSGSPCSTSSRAIVAPTGRFAVDVTLMFVSPAAAGAVSDRRRRARCRVVARSRRARPPRCRRGSP